LVISFWGEKKSAPRYFLTFGYFFLGKKKSAPRYFLTFGYFFLGKKNLSLGISLYLVISFWGKESAPTYFQFFSFFFGFPFLFFSERVPVGFPSLFSN
jgi:hypothetical protein